jgi:REP element-mobilizing transposase RayT
MFEARLAKYQMNNPEVDLTAIRYTSHGQFIYNLHLVLVNRERGVVVHELNIERSREMVIGVARKRGLLLSRGGLLGDHLHLTIGCPIDQSPERIALSFMNNIAFVHDMKHWFEFGYYVGTFGNYDLGAIRLNVAE